MQGPGQHTVADGLHHLDDACDARRGLRVPDVRLDGPQQQRPVVRALAPVGGEQRLRLDRVTQLGAGPVCLHRVDPLRGEPGIRQSLPDHTLLRGSVRRRQAVARTVLVDRRPSHHRQHPVPVAPRVGEPLHEHHAGALGPPRAVGRIGEGLAAAVGRQTALAGELGEDSRVRQHRHTAGQRHGAFARP